jgi:signal transduction histidine kinase
VGVREYLWLVVAAAAGLLVYWLQVWRGPVPTNYWQMAMFVALAVAAQHFPLTLTPKYKVDVSIGVYFACLLLFGAPVTMILVAISRLLGFATLNLSRRPAGVHRGEGWQELLFNTAQLMLATGLGGLVYAKLVAEWAPAPLNARQNLWAIPAVTATIYLVNGLLAAVMVGLQRRQNPATVWLSVWRLDALESAGIFLIGLVAAITSIYYPWAPLIMVFPAAGIYLSLRRNLTLVEQATAAMEAERRRADQAEHLAATLARVGAAADLQDALEALLRGAINLLDGEHGVAHVFGPQSGEYTSVELVVNQDGRLEKRPQRSGLLPLSGEDGAEGVDAADPNGGAEAVPGSAISVSVKASGRHIGSIRVTHHEPGLFGATDLALARALAAQAGAAIERARLEAARREAVAARQEALVELARQSEELAKREAEAAALLEVDRLKNEFLSTVSHELRTPLTVIDGYSQWLETQAHAMDTAAVQATADRIHAASAQLVRLIQDILDFARLQRGEVLVQPAELDLTPVLLEVGDGVRRQTGGDRVQWDVPPELPAVADSARVIQVVSNLVENAIKYAPEGPIAVRAALAGAAVRIEVKDVGPGIPPAEQHRVWEKFYRAQQVVELNLARGTGIGLAVVKALVEAQQGRVGLISPPGEGCCFWFEVPAATSGTWEALPEERLQPVTPAGGAGR